MAEKKEWFVEAFDDFYATVYSHRSAEQAEKDVLFAQKLLGLKTEDVVLDLCCGAGRHAKHLSALVKLVVAYDLSAPLLQLAINSPPSNNNIFWVNGDMRNLPYENNFQHLVCFFNSFGYFSEEEANFYVLKKMFNALTERGKLLLDLMNADYLKKTLVPFSSDVKEGYQIQQSRQILARDSIVCKQVVIKDLAGKLVKEYEERVRFYPKEEILKLLKRAGFSRAEFYGDHAGNAFEESSHRMLVFAQK